MSSFTFKPLARQDFNILHEWLQEPGINYWYEKGKPWTLMDVIKYYEPRILGKVPVPSFIVLLDNAPFGFIQYYSLTHFLPEGISDYENPLFQHYTASDLVGIDLFIAESNNRGKGLGTELIQHFIAEFLINFKAIVVDPHTQNQQAIRCYQKAGFQQTAFSEDSNYLLLISE